MVGTWPTPDRPFQVVARNLAGANAEGHLVLTHFPVLSLRQRSRAAELLYSGHLADLADPTGLETPSGPTVVLSGHLHLRGVRAEADVLQVVFAALIEDPFDITLVDINVGSAGQLSVSYECASVQPAKADRVPVLDPPVGSWSFVGGVWCGPRPERRRVWRSAPEGGDVLGRVGVVPKPHDLALIVECPEVHLLVAVVPATPGRKVRLQHELDGDLVATFHHVENLKVDDLHLAGGLEELDGLGSPVPRDHPGHTGLDGRVVCPRFPLDVVGKYIQDGWHVSLSEGLVDTLNRRQIAHRSSSAGR